jgi:tRNA (guanine37-N1)-methyltransferase
MQLASFSRRLNQTSRIFTRQLSSSLNAIKMDSAGLPPSFLPPVNQSMKILDRDFFQRRLPLAAASIKDLKKISDIRQALIKSDGAPLLRPLKDDPTTPGAKCFVLHPRVKKEDPSTWSPALRELHQNGIVEIRDYELNLTYDDWSMHTILEATIPEMAEDENELPTGFAQMGHVAHLNLRRQYLPYKHLIGQVLVDKNPQITTVINKVLDVGAESVFRTFPYEVLAGEDNLNVTVHESGCLFHFNCGKVYWNSRLGTEHARIFNKFKEGEAVCDVMAGVGPFAVPAGKNNVFVHANDLNPDSFTGLEDAIRRNKVDQFVSASCSDGRDFIRSTAATLRTSRRTAILSPKIRIPRSASPNAQKRLQAKINANTRTLTEPSSFDHYVMNLPANAVEFLDAFRGLYQGREAEFSPLTARQLPWIHVHLFIAKHASAEEERRSVVAKVSQHLDYDLTQQYEKGETDIHDVRLVAPNKKMYCASFRLPGTVAFTGTGSDIWPADTGNIERVVRKVWA